MLEQLFLHQKKYHLKLKTLGYYERLKHLESLENLLNENREEIVKALDDDFKKPEAETLLTEIYPLLQEIQHAKKNLRRWMRPTPVAKSSALAGVQSYIRRDPRGVCLIISPWNYPLNLALSPLIGALAAGNCVILKPSEVSRHTSAFLKRTLPRYFTDEHVAVIEGGKETTEELLRFPFDHIFFTGSTSVGKIIMTAASKHLSSVTLELGGKSPVIVDESTDLELAAEKIVWGKFLNAGQTCVAPDYILVQESILSHFKKSLIEAIERFYGKNPEEQKNSPSYARIINSQHTKRLDLMLQEALSDGAQVFYGGTSDLAENYIGPTLIEKPSLQGSLMQEEIFGPLLPILTYKNISEAIQFIQDRPKPLALYIFSGSHHNIETILAETSSGGVCINETVLHVGNHHLPFGGIGSSGQGNYHGYFGFRAFSHERAVLHRTWLGRLMHLTYPPYTQGKVDLIKTLIRWKI